MADPVLFPGVLGQIADAIGEDLATRLAEQLGGHEVQIPQTPRKGNMVVDVIGEDAARILAAEIGHGRLRLPMGPARRDERIKALLLAGRPHREIVALVRVSIRTVEYHAQRLRQHNGPPRLTRSNGDQLALPIFPENPKFIIDDMLNAGINPGDIAERIGVPLGHVERRALQLDDDPPRPPRMKRLD